MPAQLETAAILTALRAAAEPTRLRILMLLDGGELNVKDLTRILGQSQPRISRHLRLLNEAGLIERFREGTWVYFRLADGGAADGVRRLLTDHVSAGDPERVRDRERAEAVKRERADMAQAYFRTHAAEWDRIRAMHVSEAAVETAMREALGDGPFELLVDLGTGTGRVLELFADRVRRGVGLDINQAMLAYARDRLEHAGHAHCQVRQGDLYNLPLADGCAGAVVIHQVLHFLDDPGRAVAEACRLLAPAGRLLIVDFARHQLEFLREEFAHQRLGFAEQQVNDWLRQAGLTTLGVRHLSPPGEDAQERLTVSIWLASRPEQPGARNQAKRHLEMGAT
ncbi:MAG: metalloregulator ArsR/SmtB family transcription factor [Hyphomicrobiaceae bacterium]